ncbi:MAG TPA: DMT family transporter [Xanthobacteraceae bacterium]|nr:DMT family transporter [Xanthobacteraceae bacterium]
MIPREPKAQRGWLTPAVVGGLCGLGAALGWAAGFVAARHGIAIGLTPADMAFHRFVWAGLIVLPMVWRSGFSDLGGVGWWPAILLTILGGAVQSVVSHSGFMLVPLGHGAVIQPGAATLGGLLLASLVLREPLLARRVVGATAIVIGLLLLAGESLTLSGARGVTGDALFLCAGLMWALFGTFARLWNIPARRAAFSVCVLSLLVYAPLYAVFVGFDGMLRAGLWENLLQIAVQAGLAGPLPIHLYTRAVFLLGAGRAAAFPAMVPPATVLIGFVLLGEAPSLVQLAGLAVVALGFRFVLKN